MSTVPPPYLEVHTTLTFFPTNSEYFAVHSLANSFLIFIFSASASLMIELQFSIFALYSFNVMLIPPFFRTYRKPSSKA